MLTRIATFVVGHARAVLVASVIAVVGLGALGVGAFGKLLSEGFEDPNAESTAARELIDERYGGEADLVFAVHAGSGDVDDTATTSAGTDLTEELASDPSVSNVVSYWQTGAPTMRSEDGSQALIVANLAAEDAVDVTETYNGAHAGNAIDVTVGGAAVVEQDVPEQVSRDLAIAESIAVPIILILLVLAFGSLVAALLPLAIGLVAIIGTFAVLSVLGSVTEVSVFAINLTTALGLALGIDYALLMVSRYREELANGAPVRDAVIRTVGTAGRTIIFSGLAVAAALAVLLLFPMYFLRSFAYAGIGVIAIAVLGALLVMPALLTVLGPGVNAGKLPWARSLTRGSEAPVWGRIARVVMRRPLLTGGAVTVVLLVAAAPLLQVNFGVPDDRVLPESAPSRQVGDVLRGDFATNDTTAIDVVSSSSVGADDLATYASQLSELAGVERVDSSAGTFVDGEAAGEGNPAMSAPAAERLSVATDYDPQSEAARELVSDVRAAPLPAGTAFLVGGESAELADSLEAVGDRLPLAVGLVILTTLVVLFLFTGTIVQPLRALISNILTLGATLGILVLIFQEGNGSSVLGFTPLPLNLAMLVLLFCIVFGLSMDYEVFVMSRIKERHDAGASVKEATVHGLTHTGRIVTTAAALIAVSFFAFMTGQVSFLQMFGLGAGLAILLDATLVRGVLVPASMRLLGAYAWYAPQPLRRIHARLGLAES